ncbi:hypothetical protein RB195_009910 [Necator americanus]|uniref:Phlebovirus glycoprotein G2 fusion domain-containing protein n=1 Tax=Necator americanus TaxID=51031 RepID=A0ABR1CWA0_NECAM
MTLLARTIQLKKECSIGVCFDDLSSCLSKSINSSAVLHCKCFGLKPVLGTPHMFITLETDTNIRDYCSITMGTVTVKIAASERDENRIRHGCGHVRRAATMSVLGQR